MSKVGIKLKIDVTKIDKALLFKGQKGTYLDATLLPNRGGPDEYGNNYFIVQDVGKEKRLAGQKGPIIGNAKVMGSRPKDTPKDKPKASKPPVDDNDDSDIPF